MNIAESHKTTSLKKDLFQTDKRNFATDYG